MKARVEKTLRDVWQMKRAAYEETKKLSGAAYFKYVHTSVAAAFPHLTRKRHVRYQAAEESAGMRGDVSCVADVRGVYCVRRKRQR